MAYCPNCGTYSPDTSSFCSECGAPLKSGASPSRAPGYSSSVYDPTPQYVTPYPTGGLIAWSIVTLLLCTIPGIVALVKTVGINNCTTYDAQQKAVSSARTWCTVGTILGVLALIGALANM